MVALNQKTLIENLNLYLSLNQRSLVLKNGYCHGLTLLWLYKISTNQESWFYETLKKICYCKTKKDFEAISNDIEKFLNHIEWLQNPEKYLPGINQNDIDKTLEIFPELRLSFLFEADHIKKLFKKIIHEGELIVISNHNHTIGVCFKQGIYHLYDANYQQGKAKQFKHLSTLKNEMIQCLFPKDFTDKRLPLTINIAAIQKNIKTITDKKDLFEDLVRSAEKVLDKPGDHDLTNLYIACDNGDEDEVRILIEHSVNVNQFCNLEWTPLLIATIKNYFPVVSLLVENGADPNLGDSDGFTPLMLAIQNNNETIAGCLLKNGARPTITNKFHYSSLTIALIQQNWHLVVILLTFINDVSEINRQDLEKLNQNQKAIANDIIKNSDDLSDDNKKQLKYLLGSINKNDSQFKFFKDIKFCTDNDEYKKIKTIDQEDTLRDSRVIFR